MIEQMKQNRAQNFTGRLRKPRQSLLEISCSVVRYGVEGEATDYFDVDLGETFLFVGHKISHGGKLHS